MKRLGMTLLLLWLLVIVAGVYMLDRSTRRFETIHPGWKQWPVPTATPTP